MLENADQPRLHAGLRLEPIYALQRGEDGVLHRVLGEGVIVQTSSGKVEQTVGCIHYLLDHPIDVFIAAVVGGTIEKNGSIERSIRVVFDPTSPCRRSSTRDCVDFEDLVLNVFDGINRLILVPVQSCRSVMYWKISYDVAQATGGFD